MASGKDFFDGSYWHTNFKLDKTGEALLLSRPDNSPADAVEFPELLENQSFGRQPDGTKNWAFFQQPSPGSSNGDTGGTPVYHTSLAFSHPPGHYPGGFELEVSAIGPASELRYTLDGEEPTPESPLWAGPLRLDKSRLPDAKLAYFPTAKSWKSPAGEVLTHHLLNIRAFQGGQPDSETLTGTFFTDDIFPYTLPVVSLSTALGHLFDDDTGIYHAGNDNNYHKRGDGWERPAHFEFFDENGLLMHRQEIGMRVTGSTTRENPQKTLKLYARKEYGSSHFEHAFFGENYRQRFKRLSLRTLSGDWSDMAFSDDFCHQLILGEAEADFARRRFAIVLINGEYWGIHSLREFMDQHYMADKAGVSDEEINLLVNAGNYPEEGSAEAYLQLLNFMAAHDMADPLHFAKLAEQVDLDNLTDYHVLQLALANADWPNNNVKIWSAQSPGSKWRWAAADLDGCLKAANHSALHLYFEAQRALLPAWQSRAWAFFVLRKLWDNGPYRRHFASRMSGFLTTTMSPSRSLPLLRQMADELAPEMPRHIRRWHLPGSMDKWEKGIQKTEHFLLHRPPFLWEETVQWLGPPARIYPNPASNKLMVEISNASPAVYEAELMDILGQTYLSVKQELPEGTTSTMEIPLPAGMPAGTYLLRISNGKMAWVERVQVAGQ
jgi:hypothetical protein